MWSFRKSTDVISEHNSIDIDPEQYSQVAILDRAMALPAGVGLRLVFATYQAAENYKFRLYQRRTRVRRANRRLPADDAALCRSPWDDLAVFHPPGTTYLFVVRAPQSEALDRTHTRSDRKQF